jgi:murein DD-endopeptidase MepM/ murein hydrolase activator NlpD
MVRFGLFPALVLLLVAALPSVADGAPPGGGWRMPVDGEVLARFAYSPARPFAAGQQRGVDLAAAPGAVVRAACSWRVSFAGRVPSGGRGVSVRCGALTATHLGLGRVAVRRGALVPAGRAVGAAGPTGQVRLGARITARRFGWVDPLGLVVRRPSVPPAAPLGRAPRPAAPAPEAPLAQRVPRPAPADQPVPAIPTAAWAGLVVLAAGVPVGGLVRRARRRRTGPLVWGGWLASLRSSWR